MVLDSLPSYRKNDLQRIIGDQIIDIIKCSYESIDEYSESEKDSNRDNQVTDFDYFKYSYGCLLMKYKSGLEYSFNYSDVSQSVCVCVEKDKKGVKDKLYVLEDEDVKDIRSIKNYPNYSFYKLLNKEIVKINIMTKSPLTSLLISRPCEYQAEFVFIDNTHLLLGLGIETSDFAFMDNFELPDNTIIKFSVE